MKSKDPAPIATYVTGFWGRKREQNKKKRKGEKREAKVSQGLSVTNAFE